MPCPHSKRTERGELVTLACRKAVSVKCWDLVVKGIPIGVEDEGGDKEESGLRIKFEMGGKVSGKKRKRGRRGMMPRYHMTRSSDALDVQLHFS